MSDYLIGTAHSPDAPWNRNTMACPECGGEGGFPDEVYGHIDCKLCDGTGQVDERDFNPNLI